MEILNYELHRLREQNPEMVSMLGIFEEIQGVYHEALLAMGLSSASTSEVGNSAQVTISFHPTASSSEENPDGRPFQTR